MTPPCCVCYCRQVDDLQFQLEEQGVISGDQLETATEGSSQKVKNLSHELEQERRLTQQLRDQLKVCVCVYMGVLCVCVCARVIGTTYGYDGLMIFSLFIWTPDTSVINAIVPA